MMGAMVFEFFGTLGYMLAFNITANIDLLPFVLFSMIVCVFKVSGGHLNPALSLGVYIGRKHFKSDFCYLLTYWVGQLSGALLALGLGIWLRVTIPLNSSFYFVPDQNPYFPAIIKTTNGLPCYGQVFLAETLGSFMLVLVVLGIKR